MQEPNSKATFIVEEPIEVNDTVASSVHSSSEVSSEDVSDAVTEVSIVDSASLDQLEVSRTPEASGGSVSVELQATGIALQVRTHLPTHSQILDLTARLDFATQQLNLAQQNLQNAFTRIGFLEAQLQQRDELIEYLSRTQSTLPKLSSPGSL